MNWLFFFSPGDMLTPEDDQPEVLRERMLTPAHPGDALVIEGVGSYCSSMSSVHYNSFPEVCVD